MKIRNVIIDKKIIMSMLIIFLVITVLIGYSYINSDLNSIVNLSLSKYNCNQENLYDRLSCMATMDNTKSQYVSNNMGIDFSNISSDTNGKGLYTLSSTIGDNYPIHYYRGSVDNNNVKFANFCWLIVRTTDTGGTKLIYNGEPDENGHCTNRTAESTRVSSVAYNDVAGGISLAYLGYMYGTVYTYHTAEINNEIWYGDSFSFTDVDSNISGDGTYTLSNLVNDSSQISTHHYTCLNNTGICSEVAYIYNVDSTNNLIYYISINDGKSINDAISEMQQNNTNSQIKTSVDDWFNNTFNQWFINNSTNVNYYLEDTIYCNDREIPSSNMGWFYPNGDATKLLYFNPYIRRISVTPNFACSKNDAFTSHNTVVGNGKLSNRVGLLNSDEVIFAGGANAENTSYYLCNQGNYWTMSPYFHEKNYAGVFGLYANGKLDFHGTRDARGVRPVISLANYINITSGNGSENQPYEVGIPNTIHFYTITNLVKNGSFENNLTYWPRLYYTDNTVQFHTINTDYYLFGSSSLKRLANTTAARNYIAQSQLPFIEGHKYYYFLYGYTDSNKTFNILSDVANSTNSSGFLVTVNKSGWSKGGRIYTSAVTENRDISVNYHQTEDVTYIDGVGMIDLTEAFGSGNEPDLEWCNANIDYFDGTMVIVKED